MYFTFRELFRSSFAERFVNSVGKQIQNLKVPKERFKLYDISRKVKIRR